MLDDLLVVSGGQTGVDRAALDVALELGVRHAGWCPRGRIAEDGPIEPRYSLRETRTADPAERTRLNVRDADAVVVFATGGELAGGTRLTVREAERLGRPCLVLAGGADRTAEAARLAAFLVEHAVARLDVAGPRASEEPDGAEHLRAVLPAALEEARRRVPSLPAHEVLWLRPTAAQRPALEREIGRLAARLDAWPFAPHVTAWSQNGADPIPVPPPPLPARFRVSGVARSAEMRRSLVLELASPPDYEAWLARLPASVAGEPRPHLSLVYAAEPAAQIAAEAAERLALAELVLDATARVRVPRLAGGGVDPRTWRVLDGAGA